MVVKFFDFAKFHGKSQAGSTDIRVHNVIKRWPEATLYKFGDSYDVLIFQKIYAGQDYKFPVTAPRIKILDICDPDWMDNAYIHETVQGMDAVTCPTEPLAEFIRQFAQCPVRVIKDRFLTETFPKPKYHTGVAKSVVWFGYAHNAQLVRPALTLLSNMGLKLTMVTNENPQIERWGDIDHEFVKWNKNTVYEELQKHDICLLPKGSRPQDQFKSDNKTTTARLLGLPVAQNKADLEGFLSAAARNKDVQQYYERTKIEYDSRRSVEEFRQLIEEIK